MTRGGEDLERQNYFCTATIVSRLLPEALRQLFKREWNRVYPAKPWRDTTVCGQMLYNMEKSRPYVSKQYLLKYINGNTREWDSTILFDAILYSNAIGKSRLRFLVVNALDCLREIRNIMAHNVDDRVSERLFQLMITGIKRSFTDLEISTQELDEILLWKSLHTSFKILPNDSGCDSEVDENYANQILMEINAMQTMTLFFLTRIDHQLLELVGEKWFKNEQERNIRNIFVMTLNGENEDTMLESYEDLSSRVNCDEDVVSEIMTSDLSTEEKIFSLKDEVKSKVSNWTTWFLIATNVRDLKKTTRFLPQIGEEEWRNGQILIATTDVGPTFPHGKYKTISAAAEN